MPPDHAATEHLGTVTFDNSCIAAVKPTIDRAVALMHSLQFGSAIDGFHGVRATDRKYAIAYWDIALSDVGNPFAGFRSSEQLASGLTAVNQGRARHGDETRARISRCRCQGHGAIEWK